MKPITFAGCFGWFHCLDAGWGDTAALLCSGVGQDGSSGHRSFRLLADELAKTGYPTLRFDYPGTGDSCDSGSMDYWATWQESVSQALRWLRANTTARRFVLVGLRLGALLAADVAGREGDVAGLVLLAPVLRGKTYVGQLAMETRMRRYGSPEQNGGVALCGLLLNQVTQQQMRLVDLRRVQLPAGCHVAVHADEQSPVLTDCVAAWRSQGVNVTLQTFSGLEALLRPPNFADEPAADFSAVTAWLRRTMPYGSTSPQVLPALPYLGLQGDGCTETAIRFGADGHLCGILCRPTSKTETTFAVVIANSGGNPHHGFARFSVRFARHLAEAGIASFRIDFAGLGDSRGSAVADGPTHVVEVDRTGDMREALCVLEGIGYRRFAAHGVCSGAFHALHAALADHRLDTLLLINLPWFTLRHEKASLSSSAYRTMAALSERGVRVHFLFGLDDPGLRQFERHFGAASEAGCEWPSVVVEMVADWDHDLTDRGMQDTAIDAMLGFLRPVAATTA